MGDIRKIPIAATAKDEVTFFYLITRNSLAAESREERARSDIAKLVRKQGGKCRLYVSTGAAYDYVSVVTGVSTASAIGIAAEIEKGGVVKATLMPSIEIFHRS